AVTNQAAHNNHVSTNRYWRSQGIRTVGKLVCHERFQIKHSTFTKVRVGLAGLGIDRKETAVQISEEQSLPPVITPVTRPAAHKQVDGHRPINLRIEVRQF